MADNQQLLALDVGQSGSRISINGELKSIQRAMHAGEPVENTVAAILENLRVDAPKVALSLTGLRGGGSRYLNFSPFHSSGAS